LKWAFKNKFLVYFVNYEDIKNQIIKQVALDEKNNISPVRYYSWDYSDILWACQMNNFLQEFVWVFEKFSNTYLEIRTKQANIKAIFELWYIPKNTEFAFSLNPQILIEKYEKWTSSLEERLKTINILLKKWYKVGLRFLPLLPVKNYQEIYTDFVNEIKQKIDIWQIHSIFVSWLLYTKDDYNKILQKDPLLDILYALHDEWDGFVRLKKETRDFFYTLFTTLHKETKICLDTF
jgi:spore photoproduct lyase